MKVLLLNINSFGGSDNKYSRKTREEKQSFIDSPMRNNIGNLLYQYVNSINADICAFPEFDCSNKSTSARSAAEEFEANMVKSGWTPRYPICFKKGKLLNRKDYINGNYSIPLIFVKKDKDSEIKSHPLGKGEWARINAISLYNCFFIAVHLRSAMWDSLLENVDSIINEKRIILFGDFNAHANILYSDCECSEQYQKLLKKGFIELSPSIRTFGKAAKQIEDIKKHPRSDDHFLMSLNYANHIERISIEVDRKPIIEGWTDHAALILELPDEGENKNA